MTYEQLKAELLKVQASLYLNFKDMEECLQYSGFKSKEEMLYSYYLDIDKEVKRLSALLRKFDK